MLVELSYIIYNPWMIAIVGPLVVILIRFLVKKARAGTQQPGKTNAHWITPEPHPHLYDEDDMVAKERNFGPILKSFKPKVKQNIVMTGLPGVGKSHLCNVLANNLQWKYAHVGYFDCNTSKNTNALELAMNVCRGFGSNTFTGNKLDRFRAWIKSMDKMTVLFFDNVKEAQIKDITELFRYPNITVVIATTAKIPAIDGIKIDHCPVIPLRQPDSMVLFRESIKSNGLDLKLDDRVVKNIVSYTYNLPSLITQIARAVVNDRELLNKGLLYKVSSLSERNSLEAKISRKDAMDYQKGETLQFEKKVRKLRYEIFDIQNLQGLQSPLGKLSIFHPLEYTDLFMKWVGVKEADCSTLSNKGWLDKRVDGTGRGMYWMPDVMYAVFDKLRFTSRLEEVIEHATIFFREVEGQKHFRDFVNYAEKILLLARGTSLVKTEAWGNFAWVIAECYDIQLYDSNKALYWLDSFDGYSSIDKHHHLIFDHAFSRFRAYQYHCGHALYNEDLVTFEFVQKLAQDAQDAYDEYWLGLQGVDDYTRRYFYAKPFQKYGLTVNVKLSSGVEVQWIIFLSKHASLDKISQYAKDIYVDASQPARERIIALYCYVAAHIDKEIYSVVDVLSNDELVALLDEISEYSSWLCFELAYAYKKIGDIDKCASFLERATIHGNLARGFCNYSMRRGLSNHAEFLANGEFSELKFARYMQSSPVLKKNVEDCINHDPPDPEALYILGRFYEDENDINSAIHYYALATNLDNARAACALGHVYYHGTGGIEKDIDEARAWWHFGANRGHGGSYLWLYKSYRESDERSADMYLQKAVEHGSKSAKLTVERNQKNGNHTEQREADAGTP